MDSELKGIEQKIKWSLSVYNANRKIISTNSKGGRNTHGVSLLTRTGNISLYFCQPQPRFIIQE